jgi:drug/metabolite transporter (DMT)-like permease
VPDRSRWLLVAAILAVWLLWGSTYFAIRVAIETIPPFRMAALRLVTAGVVLLAISRARGIRLPTRAEWASCAATGTLMFLGGNGTVVFAERTVSSSLVAILVAAVPVYAALIGRWLGHPPTTRQAVGVVIGLLGVVVLNAGGELRGNVGMTLILAMGSIAWALGSAMTQRWPLPPGAMASAAQMIAGGAALAVASVLVGEHAAGPPSPASVGALLYLITFGSLVAFSAYGYCLRNASLPVATSYAYVNPLVAVLLGMGIGGEHLDAAGWLGLAIIVSAVVLLTTSRRS